MKTKLLLTSLLFCIFYLASSQVPQGFNYQAVARDPATGFSITGSPMKVKLTIQTDSFPSPGTILWQETHNVTTNSFGLINVIIGKGTRVSGAASFSLVDWTAWPKYFIKTEIEYPLGSPPYKLMGISRLWSVPYAMIANDFDGPVKKLSVKGETASLDETLFEVKNKDGQTIFAVYNEGVRVYVSNGAKGLKGGFAVGGFGTDKAESTKYLFVDKDSVRVYLDTNPLTKKLKGGFAVGGYDLTKGIVQDYLDVNSDSVRIYIDSNPATKKLKGGFAVGGYDMTKGTNTNYMNVNTDASGIINPSQNRILWYPLKNAFLTGRVLITNSANVGTNSFASGYESRAKGNYSQAMGYKAISDGANSTAIGNNAYATGTNSFALGDSPVASNIDSYAFGAGAIASGTGSYAFGSVDRDIGGTTTGVKTIASGPYSFAIGQGCTASNYISLAMGSLTTSSGRGSSAIGWYSIAQGEFATSFGPLTRSYGGASLSIGLGDVANSDYSTAIGTYSTATGYGSTALGHFASTNADYSTALGYHPYATGMYSVALGNYTTASGESSTSMGLATTASGSCSTALGYNTTAQCYGSLVIGRYNFLAGLLNEWNFWDPVFVIGNGSSSTIRSNAMTVYKNGIADFGWFINLNKSNTGEALKVSDAQAIWYDGNYFSWGFGGNYNVFADKVSVGTTANPGTYSLYVAGTAWCSSGAWSGSDIRWKKNITDLDDNLNKIFQLKGIRYDWKKEEFPDQGFETGTQIGLIAQEVEKIFPELVRTDDNGYKAVSYEKLSVVLLEAMKAQQKQIESTKQENQQLRSDLDELKNLVNCLITNQTAQIKE